MIIPFSKDEFLNVFELYNTSLWPIQVLLYLFAIAAIISIIKNGRQSSRIILSILAFLWAWMGSVYHIVYFSSINSAAYLFGVAFIVQGILFLYFGVLKQKIQFKVNLKLAGIIGMVLIFYALLIYPFLGYIEGHVYPRAPTFGVPCPTTIFTFGLLLFSTTRIRWYIFLVPFLWSLIGFSAAVNLSIWEDFGLVAAGVLATTILLFYKPNNQQSSSR